MVRCVHKWEGDGTQVELCGGEVVLDVLRVPNDNTLGT